MDSPSGAEGWRIRSRDATEIACWTTGDGPPLLLVHGTTADHTRWGPLLPFLEPRVTAHAMDRRGRGASGDASSYDVAREFEDVAAVVDAIAEATGSRVGVYGHSFGGFCALGAAALTSNIGKLALYEGWPAPNPAAMALPPGVEEKLDELLDAGESEVVIETFLREALRMTDEQLDALRAQPSWASRVAAAHTITRETRVERTIRLDPDEALKVTVPVLLLGGETSPEPFKTDIRAVAGVLPNARVALIPGQSHAADVFAPDLVAEAILPFLLDAHPNP